ncbi:hypothetical protein [Erythrobacter sp. SD-21]|uniref:hypothetical protein n=1 Tax=Erythrobacter sp. SD-21 TaxID=161528 RepID=UPI0012E9A913|nr:hypothetical protein [Erythrobacter sp. SD-21]
MRNAILTLISISLGVPAAAQEAEVAPNTEEVSETDVTLLAGAKYASGNVNGQGYETVSLSTGISARSGRFSLATFIPYVVTTAPEELIVSNGGVLGTPLLSQPSTQSREVTREGIGDLILQGGYAFPIGSFDAFVAGHVKVPTASREKALGTGELDYGVSGQVSRRTGRTVPFASASYTVVGELEGFDVQNTVAGRVGSHFLLSNTSSVTASYSYEQSATANVEDHQSLGVGLDTSLSTRIRLGVDARAGLSSDAPDARLGLRIGIGF